MCWIAVQGFFMFGFQLCLRLHLRRSTSASGLVAVVFSLIVFWNILGMRCFFSAPINPVTLFGSGARRRRRRARVLARDRELFVVGRSRVRGLGFALVGTIAASLGNLAALRNQKSHIPIVPQMAWAMCYGTLFIAIYAAAPETHSPSTGRSPTCCRWSIWRCSARFSPSASTSRSSSASASDRAGYVGVAIPIVALLLSTLFEDLRWDVFMGLGVLFCVAGNVLILRDSARAKLTPA